MSNYLTYSDAFFASSADTMEYVIKQGDTYIFRGIAIKAPGADYAYIDVGKICKQYLDNNLPDFRDFNDQITRLPNALQKFTLSSVQHIIIWTGTDTYLDDVTEQVEEIYSFLFNWDYEGTAYNEGMPLSDPVNGHMDCRMKLIYTQYSETTVKDFYVTPLLSSPVQGGTLTAKITTEYTDVSKLTVTVDNPDVVVQNYSLTGVTFVTPANNGKTVATTVHYYYDGKLVGKTEIILAGEQGGDPEDPDTPIIVEDGQIPGTAIFKSGTEDKYTSIIGITGNRSGSTLFSVYGSDYITGRTVSDGLGDALFIKLIDANTPAPLGDKVNVSITSNNITVQKEYTVTVRWNAPYAEGGVKDYRLVDTFGVEGYIWKNHGSYDVIWGNDYNYLKIKIGGDYGGYWPNGYINNRIHYLTHTGNNVFQSSMVIRFMEISEQLKTDNYPADFSGVTINSGITSLKFEKSINTNETVTVSGVTDLYYNGTLAQWNSLENVDNNTWNAYHNLNYVERSLNPRKMKIFSYPEGDVGVTSLTVHCSDGVTEWTKV